MSVTSAGDAVTQEHTAGAPRKGRNWLAILVVVVILLDVVAFLLFPPFDKGGQPGDACAYPVCFINGTLEFPPPHVITTFDGSPVVAAGGLSILFQPSLTNTMLTMFIVTAVLLVALLIGSRGRAAVPGRVQNFIEWAVESLDGFATGMGGPMARPYVPMFICFFMLILAFNWSGLVPPIGKVEELRAPTSDVNVTIGLALVAFITFEVEGFRRLGFRGYAGKFFPFYEFKNGIGAGLIALFVGLVELLLEFVKPLTLSMRLFGNIYGGEVALGVVTALFVAILPVALYGLEIMLTFVQALIFSTLTLMFTIAAIESHHQEEGELGEEGMSAVHEATHPQQAAAH
jgi:F-type H+-transporting ATPase subunit a